MKNFRLSVALLLLALVFAIVPAAFAQDSTFGASQEDFDLWTAANTALTASSASFDFTASLAGTSLGGDNVGDMNAEVSGKGAFDLSDSENPVFWLDATATTIEDGEPKEMSLNLRIVDNFVYTNTGDGWEQQALGDALGSVTNELGVGDLAGSVDPSDLSADSAMSMFGDLNVNEFISLTRDGGDFSLSVDIAGLISSPAILPMIMGMSGGGEVPEMDEAQMAQMNQMFAMMFGEAELSFNESVDEGTQNVNSATFVFDLPLEAMMGTPGAGLSLSFDVKFTGHGEPVSVEAPEGATMVESDS